MNMKTDRPAPPCAIESISAAPIRAVLFDLDDTLWPIVPVLTAAEELLYEWLQQHAPSVAAAHTVDSLRTRRTELLAAEQRYRFDMIGLRTAVLAEAFEACGEDPAKVAVGMALFNAARNRVTPFDDVLPALTRLRDKVLLGSISNGAADLAAIGMADHFRMSISAREFGSAKPDPGIFMHACALLQVAPAEAVYVGDDPALDVLGAQQAGLRTVWINRFDRALPAHIRPDAVCVTLDELETWLIADAGRAAQGA
ncbi:MAG: putative hydrolase [Herbaspirillum sp.]|nr:putative hydrolase [Herbaspirillum sp.]